MVGFVVLLKVGVSESSNHLSMYSGIGARERSGKLWPKKYQSVVVRPAQKNHMCLQDAEARSPLQIAGSVLGDRSVNVVQRLVKMAQSHFLLNAQEGGLEHCIAPTAETEKSNPDGEQKAKTEKTFSSQSLPACQCSFMPLRIGPP